MITITMIIGTIFVTTFFLFVVMFTVFKIIAVIGGKNKALTAFFGTISAAGTIVTGVLTAKIIVGTFAALKIAIFTGIGFLAFVLITAAALLIAAF